MNESERPTRVSISAIQGQTLHRQAEHTHLGFQAEVSKGTRYIISAAGSSQIGGRRSQSCTINTTAGATRWVPRVSVGTSHVRMRRDQDHPHRQSASSLSVLSIFLLSVSDAAGTAARRSFRGGYIGNTGGGQKI